MFELTYTECDKLRALRKRYIEVRKAAELVYKFAFDLENSCEHNALVEECRICELTKALMQLEVRNIQLIQTIFEGIDSTLERGPHPRTKDV